MVKNMPAMLETWVRSLGRENSLEKGMATQSSIFGRNTGDGENEDGYFKQKGPQVQGREVICL